MKLKIGRSGYVLLLPDVLEAGLSHDVGGTVEVHVLSGSVVLGTPVETPRCMNAECRKPLTDRAICQDCRRAYAEDFHRRANIEAAARLVAARERHPETFNR